MLRTKLSVVFLTLMLCLSCATAYERYYPSRRCIDCWGNYRYPGDRYFDGCNWCRCRRGWYGPRASCSYRYCEYNRCYKRRGYY